MPVKRKHKRFPPVREPESADAILARLADATKRHERWFRRLKRAVRELARIDAEAKRLGKRYRERSA